jgi:hypothetical protein
MGNLSETRVGAVRRLIEQAPDGAIRSLESALANGGRADGSIALVQDIVNAEMLERRVRAAVFAPILPLCAPPPDRLPRLSAPPNAPSLAWRGIKLAVPELASRAVRSSTNLAPDDEPPPTYDEICERAAQGLRAGEAAFEPLRQALAARGAGEVEQFACLLSMSPLARAAIRRLPAWVRTLNSEHAAAIRLAFRDADQMAEQAGPLFMELLLGHLEEPAQILRLISLVMDRPNDRYLAASELASFGERLMSDLDARVEAVRRLEPDRGLEAGVAVGVSVQAATTIIGEFEQWLQINREGPWGRRLVAQKRALAMAVEARLRQVDPAVAAALPLQPLRAALIRGGPKLDADPDPQAVRRAHAFLGFFYETRTAANYGGFGAVRARVLENLDARIGQYTEDLLEILHSSEAPTERVHAYLEVVADFVSLVRDPRAGDIVRRRAAAAA